MSDAPFFSIIIPTRERHHTLYFTIQTVLNQSFNDFELIVMDNMSSVETKNTVQKFSDHRIKYFYSPERLSMRENWEKALMFAKGDFIFFLGDDDAILPDALETGYKILENSDFQILTWVRDDCMYYWKDCILESHRNFLLINIKVPEIKIFNGLEALKAVYDFKQMYQILPMVYSSFVHREVISEIMLIYGKYFCDDNPDVFSGIVNAYFTENYLFSFRPLSMAGVSGSSTGMSFSFPHLSSKSKNMFLSELGDDAFSNSLLPSYKDHILISIADTLLKTKSLFFRDDERINFNPENFLSIILSSCGFNPDSFDDEILMIKQIAEKYEIPLSSLELPQKSSRRLSVKKGFVFEDRTAVSLWIDCNVIGIDNIYEASQLVFGAINSMVGD